MGNKNLSTNEDKVDVVAAGQEQPQAVANPVKAKHGLKPFAFFSGVFDILISLFIVALGVYIIWSIFAGIDTGNDGVNIILGALLWPVIVSIAAIFLTGAILLLVSGILTIISSFKSDRKNFNGLLVSIIVFDVLIIFGLLFFIFSFQGRPQIYSIVLAAVTFVGLIFKIIDISLTNKRLKKYNAAKQEENRSTFSGPNFDNLKTQNSSSQPNVDNDNKNGENEKKDSSDIDFSKLKK